MIEWREITLAMPWGTRLYRYTGRKPSGSPLRVEVMVDGEWMECPNFNVYARIAKMESAG
jgi:hypothetical protein